MSEPTPSYSKAPFKPGAARRRLAENLRIIRVLRQWSQEELAAAAGLDRSYIGSIERAERSAGIDSLEKLAHVLDLTICDLTSEPDPQRIAETFLDVVRGAVDGKPMRVREEWAEGCQSRRLLILVCLLRWPLASGPRRPLLRCLPPASMQSSADIPVFALPSASVRSSWGGAVLKRCSSFSEIEKAGKNHAVRFVSSPLSLALSRREWGLSVFVELIPEIRETFGFGRKRLERAANSKKELSLTEIAVATGFSSGANFAKSFKLYFGGSPRRLRKPGGAQNSKIEKIFSKYGSFQSDDLYPSVSRMRRNTTRTQRIYV